MQVTKIVSVLFFALVLLISFDSTSSEIIRGQRRFPLQNRRTGPGQFIGRQILESVRKRRQFH